MEDNKKIVDDAFIQSMEDKLNTILWEKFEVDEVIELNLIKDDTHYIFDVILNDNEKGFKIKVDIRNEQNFKLVEYKEIFFNTILSEILSLIVKYIEDEKTQIKRKIKII